MSRRYRHTRQSRQDAEDIWRYIAEDSPARADAQLARFSASYRLIAEHPDVGRSRPELGRDLRSLPEGSYLIFYRVRPDGPQIVRILHGRRNITSGLF